MWGKHPRGQKSWNMKKTPCEWWMSSHFGAGLKQLPSKEKPVPGRRLDEPISKASSIFHPPWSILDHPLWSSHLGPFRWTNIYWAPTVWHTSGTEPLLYLTSGLLRLASCASHSCGPLFSAGVTQFCAEAAWLDLAACRHHGPLAFYFCFSEAVIGCPGEPTCNSCLHNLEW